MVYKIGNACDLNHVPVPDSHTFELLFHFASVLTNEYGADRNIDEDDGGFVLYATQGTNAEDIKASFDYSKHTAEYSDRYDDICATMYILHNEFAVVLVMSLADAPKDILDMLD